MPVLGLKHVCWFPGGLLVDLVFVVVPLVVVFLVVVVVLVVVIVLVIVVLYPCFGIYTDN